ncbi:hypothetical protein SAMN05720268_1367 [Polaribacter sp. KT 15]|nr:hypothetical protein SAMN05720268_1367 [Polaribacter sp. KT 15]
MKKTFSILLFIAFAFRPAYHLAYIGYFELNIDYIIEKYCVNKDAPELQCNGKCHLAKKIAPQVNLEKDNVAGLQIVSEAFFPVYHQETENFTAKYLDLYQNKLPSKKNSLHTFLLIKNLEQPPDLYL